VSYILVFNLSFLASIDVFAHSSADFWKRSEGSGINYTGRVVKALLDLQEEEYASWPTDEIRHEQSQVRKRAGYFKFDVLVEPWEASVTNTISKYHIPL